MQQLRRALLLAMAAGAWASVAQAQAFPSKPIKIIVAFGPGSGGDGLARLLGQHLQPELNTPVVVENYAFVLVVPASSPARTPTELVQLLRAKGSSFYGYGNATGRAWGAAIRAAGLQPE